MVPSGWRWPHTTPPSILWPRIFFLGKSKKFDSTHGRKCVGMRWLSLLALQLAVTVTGCVGEMGGSVWSDGRFSYINVKSASDAAGGPRQDLILVIDRDGRIIGQWQAAGPGVLQALVGSLGPAVMTAAGTAAAGALQRPSRNTTNVSMDVQGTGGSGGSGGSNVTTATLTGGTGGSATGVVNER